MQINVIGIRKVDMTNDNGFNVVGSSLYYLQNLDPRNGIGEEVKKVFVNENIASYSSLSASGLGVYELEQWDKKIVKCHKVK